MDKFKQYLLATAGLVILAGVLALSSETRAQGPRGFIPGPPCGVSPVWQRFVVSQDGTEVCDNTTGVVWQQEPLNQELQWQQAVDACVALGDAYHLPEVWHLLSLVDYGEINPPLPSNNPFINVVSGLSGTYWSATSLATSPTRAWLVRFSQGWSFVLGKDDSHLVWCAR